MMSEMFWIALMQFAVKFGLDSAILFATSAKTAKTIDDAIAALGAVKTAQKYLDEAPPPAQ